MHCQEDPRNEVELRFRDVRVTIHVSRMKAFLTGGKAEEKEILKGIDGIVASGQILAIIGPSGAGKTTLLDTLVGKGKYAMHATRTYWTIEMKNSKDLSVKGEITVNGQPMSQSFLFENAAYVPQENRLWGALSVRENLMFACKLYCPDLAKAERESRVNKVLTSLGLESCQDTKIGNILVRGASGGQKRRTAIGVELVTHRKILFLDEPTSGLDAASAAEIMAQLRRLASDTGVIIVASVHQPSTHVFNSFDQVILLTMGQTAYFGPARTSLQYFASQGYRPQGLVNPADYLLEITNADFSNCDAVQRLANAWFKTDSNTDLMAQLNASPLPALPTQPKRTWLASIKQLNTLIDRAVINSVRDPAAYALRLVLYIIMSLFLGSVYYRLENTQSDILNRVFLVLWINGFNAFMTLAAVPVFSVEGNAVVKEIQNGQYGILNYCVANVLVQAPFVFLIAVCCSTPAYWITSMNDDLERYGLYIVIIFLMLFVIESMAQLIGVIVKNFILAIALFSSILSVFFLFNGFFVNPRNMPGFWVWIFWLSPSRYAWELHAYVVFDGQTYSGMENCTVCYGSTGNEVLRTLGADGGTNLAEVSMGEWCGMLFMLSMLWKTLHYFTLRHAVL